MSDVNSDKGSEELESASLKYLSLAFISFIFVIIILAVGTQLIFSPEKVTTWVKASLEETGFTDKLNESKIKIEFKKAQTTLTGSLLYPIGVRLNDIKVSADRGCDQYTSKFNSVVVPFGIFAILKGNFKLGTIKLSQGSTELSNVCKPQMVNAEAKPSSDSGSFEKSFLKFDYNFKKLFQFLQHDDTSIQKVQGVLVYDWSYVERSKPADIKLTVDRFKVYNLKGQYILKGEWAGNIGFKKETLDFDGEVVVSEDEMSLSSELKYKEGKAYLNHTYQRGQNSVFEASVDHIPMSIFVSLFSLEDRFSNSFLRASWLSFKLNIELLKEQIKGKLNSFDIKTEDGTMDLVSGEASGEWTKARSRWSLDKSIKFIFTNFKALNLLNVEVQKDLSKVLSNFGKFDLSLTIDERLSVKGAFESSGQSLSVRSGGRLGVQKILSALGDFTWGPDKDFEVRLNQMKLERGEFEGEFIYTLNKNSTKLIADVRELSLDPDLWGEVFKVDNVGSLSLKGQAEVERGLEIGRREVVSQFTISLSQLAHKLWVLQNAIFDCAYSEFLACNLRFSNLEPRAKLKEWFSKDDRSDLIKDLRRKGEITLKDKSLELNLFYRRSCNGKLNLKWSVDQGPVLEFPNESRLSLREL